MIPTFTPTNLLSAMLKPGQIEKGRFARCEANRLINAKKKAKTRRKMASKSRMFNAKRER